MSSKKIAERIQQAIQEVHEQVYGEVKETRLAMNINNYKIVKAVAASYNLDHAHMIMIMCGRNPETSDRIANLEDACSV